ncbi:hypothetical protein JVU11DRAFT_9618 [Chiua virens]|nr:hypothetical protein JVU11DRAFT_9618 [Chiua virens]
MPAQPVEHTLALKTFFLELSGNDGIMEALGQGTLDTAHTAAITEMAHRSGVSSKGSIVDTLLLLVGRHDKLVTTSLRQAIRTYRALQKNASNRSRTLKRTIAYALGLHKIPVSYQAICHTGAAYLLVRERMEDSCFKHHSILVDAGNEDLVQDTNKPVVTVSLDTDNTWHVVKPDENAIFINKMGEVELAILRNSCAPCPELLSYVNTVIQEAVLDRRGCRPSHPGKLIQCGWNAGPRHARVFGLVRNIKHTISGEERAQHDQKILGICSLSWNLLTAHLPKEVVDGVSKAIAEADLPNMSMLDDYSDDGYELQLPSGTLSFKTAPRAPAEAYLVQNYSAPIHKDKLYAPYALNWSTQCEPGDVHESHPEKSLGGNFVDVSLRVVVQSAADTFMAIRPGYKHGTTHSRPGTLRQGVAINFSTHIKEAYDTAIKAGGFHLEFDGGSLG